MLLQSETLRNAVLALTLKLQLRLVELHTAVVETGRADSFTDPVPEQGHFQLRNTPPPPPPPFKLYTLSYNPGQ